MAGPGPLAELLGILTRTMGDGRATFELAVKPDHMNPDGAVHGGVIYSLLDTAMGGALMSLLVASGERCATLEIKVNYLLPVAAGSLRAEAAVVSRTKRTAVLEARVLGDDDRPVAIATGTFYVMARSG